VYPGLDDVKPANPGLKNNRWVCIRYLHPYKYSNMNTTAEFKPPSRQSHFGRFHMHPRIWRTYLPYNQKML